MNILYICFIDFNNINSGNALRPYKMYEAFTNLGHNVLLLATNQDRSNKQNRKKEIEQIILQIEKFNPDICYYESPTLPIKYNYDYKLIKIIKSKNIPCAYFYRDFYFSFRNIVIYKSLKDYIHSIYMKILKVKTERILSIFDIVYFPSKECFRYFKYKDMRVLPPAASPKNEYNFINNNTAIYVGGLARRYGTDILEKTFENLNKSGEYKLIIVCREDDYQNYEHLSKHKYIEIVHASGKDLKAYYDKSSVALLPLEKNAYNDLAVAIKTFEYMSYGKPILATSNLATKNIIDECRCGICCDDNSEQFEINLKKMFNDLDLLRYYSKNAYNAIQNNHNWEARAEQVCRELMAVKNAK